MIYIFILVLNSYQIFIPNFDHIFDDLSKLSIEQISQLENSLLQTALHIQFLRFLDSIDAKLLIDAFAIFDYSRTETISWQFLLNHINILILMIKNLITLSQNYLTI